MAGHPIVRLQAFAGRLAAVDYPARSALRRALASDDAEERDVSGPSARLIGRPRDYEVTQRHRLFTTSPRTPSIARLAWEG